MAIITPYVTDKFTAYLGDVLTTRLSLAVWLIDDYTKKELIGSVKVMTKEGDIMAIKNLSGYYCFNDLPDGNYNLNVESDFYFPEVKTVDIPQPDPKNPVVEITLKPKPAYPFPDHATLVRGMVVGAGEPVVNAEVKVVNKAIENVTDEKGEFVLYFERIKEENITIKIKKDASTKSVNTTVKEGKAVSLGVITFP